MKLWQTGAIYENGKISPAAGPSADGSKKTIAYYHTALNQGGAVDAAAMEK